MADKDGHSFVSQQEPDLMLESGGHPRSFSGRTCLPGALPVDVAEKDIQYAQLRIPLARVVRPGNSIYQSISQARGVGSGAAGSRRMNPAVRHGQVLRYSEMPVINASHLQWHNVLFGETMVLH
jgi:hypothetical protein